MSYSIEKVATLVGAHRYGHFDMEIEWLLTDSRSLAFPETTLFFAIRTRTGDGHRYIDDLYRRGVRNFVVSAVPWTTGANAGESLQHAVAAMDSVEAEAKLAARYPGANFLKVVSPLKALQRLAERHREEHEVPVIGITGSNGKTTVKEWIYQLASPSHFITRSPRSYNSQVGVPLSGWLLNERTEVGMFEAGISQPGEMQSLRAIIQPTVGVMTNIGEAHQENFASLEEKCLEKLSLFDDAETLVYDADNELVCQCLEASRFHGRRFGWSRRDSKAPLFVKSIERTDGHSLIRYRYGEHEDEAGIPFTDEASVENAIHAIAVALLLGIPRDVIARQTARLQPVAMRLEVKQGVRGITLINDAYNSDLTGLDIALDFQRRRRRDEHRAVVILSDLLQTGITDEALYRRVNDMLQSRGVDVLIGIGPALAESHSIFSGMEKHFYATTDEFLKSSLLHSLHDDVVLLKGARDFRFDTIAEVLELKVHETVLEVNLGALAENVRYYRSFMKPGIRLTCMVKAGA